MTEGRGWLYITFPGLAGVGFFAKVGDEDRLEEGCKPACRQPAEQARSSAG